MENLDNIMQEIRDVQGGVNEVLRDTLGDYKEREAARDKKEFRKDITIWVLILALVASFAYFQWTLWDSNNRHQQSIERLATENDVRFKEFLSQYDFQTSVDVQSDNNSWAVGGGGDVTYGGESENNPADDTQGQ